MLRDTSFRQSRVVIRIKFRQWEDCERLDIEYTRNKYEDRVESVE